jgi:primosomal protein N' (replication factor Y)
VLIQTEYPEHPLLKPAGQRLRRLRRRRAARNASEAAWPPFIAPGALRASDTQPEVALKFLTPARPAAAKPRRPRRALLGPVPAAMVRRADRYHAQLLVESSRAGARLQALPGRVAAAVEQLPEAAQAALGAGRRSAGSTVSRAAQVDLPTLPTTRKAP